MSALHKLLDTVQIGFMTPTPDMIAEARAELAALRAALAALGITVEGKEKA